VESSRAGQPHDRRTALRLCAELVTPWWHGGHFAEARDWLERAVALGGSEDAIDVGRCLVGLARIYRVQDDLLTARARAAEGVSLLRGLEEPVWLCRALLELGHCDEESGDFPAARLAIGEATALSRALRHEPRILSESLTALARVEAHAHNFTQSSDLDSAATAIASEAAGLANPSLTTRHNAAWILERMGRLEEARQQILELIPDVIRLGYPELLLSVAENYATVLAELGHSQEAARLLGAVDAMRERLGAPRHRGRVVEHDALVARARAAVPATWDREYLAGRSMAVEEILSTLEYG
jgi:tetratricopeptide (TPR) repeat protein